MSPNTVNKASELKISDIPEKYPKQWVTVEITQRDECGWPFAGKVVLCVDAQEDIVGQMKNLQGNDLYTFYTGRIDDSVKKAESS